MIVADAPVETFDEIDSTMLEARRRAERGELGPVWLVAKRQSAGRGRRGRTWVSEEGNLYVIVIEGQNIMKFQSRRQAMKLMAALAGSER